MTTTIEIPVVKVSLVATAPFILAGKSAEEPGIYQRSSIPSSIKVNRYDGIRALAMP